MRYLSLFSGIEGATAAFEPLGWEPVAFAQYDPEHKGKGRDFASEVLNERYPHVPNLGNIENIMADDLIRLGHIDLIIAGWPCQDVSVAGKRRGFKDGEGEVTRSGLFFEAIRLVRLAREHCGLRFLIGENVPGLFSSHKGRDFATVVGEVVGTDFDPPRDGWQDTGVALGPDGFLEWCVLDAQWFGLAQRRARVFVVADFGDWSGRQPILLESEGMLGDPPSRRQAGQGTAASIETSAGIRSHWDGPDEPHPTLNQVGNGSSGGVGASNQEIFSQRGAYLVGEPQDVVGALACNTGPNGHDAGNFACNQAVDAGHVVPVSLPEAVAFQSSQSGVRLDDVHATLDANNGPRRHNGVLAPSYLPETSPALRARDYKGPPQDVEEPAFVASYVQEVADPITTTENKTWTHEGTNFRTRNIQAIAYGIVDDETSMEECMPTMPMPSASGGGHPPAVYQASAAVRRLTPVECERLQGYRDGYTQISWRGKPPEECPDGPRYRALGNSFPVPVIRWIGQRIDLAVGEAMAYRKLEQKRTPEERLALKREHARQRHSPKPPPCSVGAVYGLLTVVEIAPSPQGGKYRIKAQCECGTEKHVRFAYLRDGRVKSCGCIKEAYTYNINNHRFGGALPS